MTQQGQRNMFHKNEREYASLEFIIAKNLVSVLPEGLLRKRYALFEKHISSMKGDAREKYVNVINQVIKEIKVISH